jgi:hypothetical protein
VIFQAFPRTGTARWFAGYSDYVVAVDALIASGALSDPSFLWWDVRLQPALGTVEVRAMDAQSSVGDSVPLVALVQSLAMLVLEGGPPNPPTAPEVLAENRFLAARDGLQAQLINPATRQLEPARELVYASLNGAGRSPPRSVAPQSWSRSDGWPRRTERTASAPGPARMDCSAWSRPCHDALRHPNPHDRDDRGQENGRAQVPADDQLPGREAVRIAN